MIAYIRVVDGVFKKGEAIRAMATATEADIDDIGFFSPQMMPTDQLAAGEVGYLITGLKDVTLLRVGDTLTTRTRTSGPGSRAHGAEATEALPGYREVKPMVFCGLFPIDSDDYPDLRDALEKLVLNDAALSWEPETSDALGFGFRCGFLGLLHMDIVKERLEREYDLELLATMPSVEFDVTLTNGEELEVHNPSDMPDPGTIEQIREPFITASIIAPKEFVGAVMELCQERRGVHSGMHYLSPERVQLNYELPLAEIVLDFFDQLKSRTKGYASLDYELSDMKESDLVKLDVLLAGDTVDALSMVVHRDKAYEIGRTLDGEAAQAHPPPAVRRPDPGGDRRQRDRARDRQGVPQGRDRGLLRRRHHAQEKAARQAEGGQEADEAGRPRRGSAGGVPGGAGAGRGVVAVAVATREPIRILFVCLGNICRSPTAEGVMRALVREAGLEDAIELDSAGTGALARRRPAGRARHRDRARSGNRAGGRGAPGARGGLRRFRPDPRDGPLEPRRAAAPGARRAGAREGAAAARVRPGERGVGRSRCARSLLRRPAGIRGRARPRPGRLCRSARGAGSAPVDGQAGSRA